jgi:hypothetical protein
MGYKGVMEMPIRAFWLFCRSMDRIEAQSQKSLINAHAASQSGEDGQRYIQDLDKAIGQTLVLDELEQTEEEQIASFAELRKALK